jgi:hypothetical protein
MEPQSPPGVATSHSLLIPGLAPLLAPVPTGKIHSLLCCSFLLFPLITFMTIAGSVRYRRFSRS